ncbi:uncharacterized protein FJT64_020061 [Amphibalanus amphitrite]|uniref:RNA-directed DNA polymerase n=1 Tax=Amphibalanus amphitrite TaxID=1232801 RepID=A0A6A4WPG2_AMPAM|nr:uncharacterized protein FJT64_020061 [Amphibalanus amphitrite]
MKTSHMCMRMRELEIGGSRCRRVALIDSGCTRTLVHESVCHQWRRSAAEVITVNGQRLQCEGAAEVRLAVPGCRAVEVSALVIRERPLGFAVIVGMDAIRSLGGVTVRSPSDVQFGCELFGSSVSDVQFGRRSVACAATGEETGLKIEKEDFVVTFDPTRRRGVAFSPSSSRLYGFGQQPLPVLGTLPTTVTYNNQAVPTNFYLVDTKKTEAIMVMEQLRSVIRTGWPDAARQCTPETRDYFAVRHELQVRQDGVVLRGPDRAVVPAALRSKYLQLAHRAHDGVVRTKQLLRDLAWWPGMSKDAAALVADCPSCHAKDAVLTQQARPAPLQPVELPDRPWSKLGLDIMGPIPGAPPSAKYAITMTDYHSKWPEVALTSSIETDDVIQFLSQAWSREGLCDELVTDNGPQFTSDRFRQYLAQRSIRHHTSAVYWPRGNGAVERLNREVKVWLKEATQLQSRTAASFSGHVRQRLALYRATPHCTTGQSPSALLHGRRMRLHLPVTTETPPRDSSLQHRVATQQQRNSRGYDSRQATRPSDLQPGDTVRVR